MGCQVWFLTWNGQVTEGAEDSVEEDGFVSRIPALRLIPQRGNQLLSDA